MARAIYVKAARRDYKEDGIKKGEGYYWWKFRFGSKHRSKSAPRRSQLTQSEFLGNMYDIEDELADLASDDLESLKDTRDDLVSRLQDLASEAEDRLSNMPDSLQYSPTGEMLQNRADECNSMADELDGVDLDFEHEVVVREKDETDTNFERRSAAEQPLLDEEYQEKIDEAISELQNVSYSGE